MDRVFEAGFLTVYQEDSSGQAMSGPHLQG